MAFDRPSQSSRSCSIVDSIHARLAQRNLYPASSADIESAYRLALELIGPGIARPEVLQRVQNQTGAAMFIARDRDAMTGVLALVMLNEAGRRAVVSDAFNAIDPPAAELAHRGDPPAALYVWGAAATTLRTAQRLIEGYMDVDRFVVPHLDCFSRPATPAGERILMGRLRFRALEGSRSGLVCRRGLAKLEAAA
jgi:hypothetical protein